MSLHDDVEEILLDSETVASRVAELGAQIAADYAGRDPVLISAEGGARVPRRPHARDGPIDEHRPHGGLLLRRGDRDLGQVRILKDLSKPIEGRDVLVVEDIIDTGLNLNYLLDTWPTRDRHR